MWQNGQHDTLTRECEKKNFAMKLNIRAQSAQNLHNNSPIVLVHGIGHSMGGKAVMALTALAPDRIDRLVAIDIAPVDYHVRRHDAIFTAINAVTDAQATSRQQAASVMRQHLHEEGVIQFLLKSFVDGEWRFNVPVLWDQYPHIVGWETIPAWEHPALFIPGGNSPYVTEAYREQLLIQFPQARAHVIAGAGHWVHAEKPEAVLRAIRRYLNEQAN